MKKYATANIITSAKLHCKPHHILLLLDGDDELIGRHTLSLLSHTYRTSPKTVIAYTNNLSNRFHYGGSKLPTEDFFTSSKRSYYHFTAPVRSYLY